ncbi:MAG: SWIM zinc finger family protein [Anaerolineae bacterium]|nr:SWIM zinc finger family protein [Anaerolineae bacterium]
MPPANPVPHWNATQALAAVKDPKTARDALKIAFPGSWSALGWQDSYVWGECHGSGSAPYKTQVDVSEPGFRCNCPSRKTPCKHAAALFVMYAGQPHLFPEAAPPGWVADWMATRVSRHAPAADTAALIETETPSPPPKRLPRPSKREMKVRAGLQELALWLEDLARRGLAEAATQPPGFWEQAAARLVDAQAPGAARRIRRMARWVGSRGDWPDRLLEEMARLHLLVTGMAREAALDADLRAELRAQIGWTEKQRDLLTRPGLRDRWLALGCREETENNLREQRLWLMGVKSGRPALALDYAFGVLPFKITLPPGVCISAELVYYPGVGPLRALIKEPYRAAAPPAGFPAAHAALRDATGQYGAWLARNPWLERFPLALASIIPYRTEDGWWVQDTAGDRLPLDAPDHAGWQLLALSGGHPIGLAGEWDGRTLCPLSAYADGRFVALPTQP